MAELKYKTRGMSSYRDKAKVFFLCHPDDFTKYFESVSDEILELQNAAVWYEAYSYYVSDSEQGDKSEEERKREEQLHFENLKEMQLVVVPVSETLIHQGNAKVDADFAFAREQHIPILPLLQEDGLENAFSEKYGNIHLLNKTETDIYAINYKEKLKKFLETVLVGEGTIAQIRNEFRGYVFLSYRKIDREWTSVFMERFHDTEEYRDIGIWYDELLVPGNNFDEDIREALDKSDIMAVVVTPNILQEGNYVMNVEYPEAVKAKKKIVPVIFRGVDEGELQTAYRKFPRCINSDIASIREAFREAFVSVSEKTDCHNEARHHYLLGLAYLYGIDVEKNIELAENYLKDAMEQGELKAAEQLVEIWQMGIGVKKDVRKAREYQRQLEYKLMLLYDKEDTIETALNYVEACVRRADMFREEGELDTAIYLYESVLDFQDKIMDKHQIVSNFYQQACNGLSDIFRRTGDDARAEGYLRIAQKTSEDIYAGLGDKASTIHMIKNYGNLAYMCCLKESFAEARMYLLNALNHVERLRERGEDPEVELLWSSLMIQAGYVLRVMGEDAREKFEEALPVAKRAAEELMSQEAYYNLINCYGYLGDIAADNGLILKAGDYYLLAQELCVKLVKEIGNARAYDRMAATHIRVAYVNKGYINRMSVMEALRIYEMLVNKYPEETEYKKACEMIREALGI